MITTGILSEIRSYFPDVVILDSGSEANPFGNGGAVTVFPKTEEEISSLLKYANDTNKKINVIGGGTKRGFGGTADTADLLLSLADYNGIVEHVPGDMTLTVRAGTAFNEIQDYLLKFNQKIALDPFLPARATIGGIIAANESGPKRLGYGSARDAVIGMRIVYPDGKVIRSGGKVVKNVAGYDMNKLFIGAMGTLGVVSEITLKLRPITKADSLLLLKFPGASMESVKAFAIQILDTVVEPVALELMNPSLSEKLFDERVYALAISFEDVESSVHYQEEYVRNIQPSGAELTVLKEQDAKSFWTDFYENVPNANEPVDGHGIEATLKIGTVNMDVTEIVKASEALQDTNNLHIEAHGGLGHGISQVVLRGAEPDIVSAIQTLREKAVQLNGYVVVKHLPLALRREIEVWGEKPAYQFLLDGVKAKVDPNRVLNPGRFVGGI